MCFSYAYSNFLHAPVYNVMRLIYFFTIMPLLGKVRTHVKSSVDY